MEFKRIKNECYNNCVFITNVLYLQTQIFKIKNYLIIK